MAALTLFMSIFNPGLAVPDGTSDSVQEEFSTTTTLVSATVFKDLEECDLITVVNDRNLCYATATSDSFFCDRIEDTELKNSCYLEITG